MFSSSAAVSHSSTILWGLCFALVKFVSIELEHALSGFHVLCAVSVFSFHALLKEFEWPWKVFFSCLFLVQLMSQSVPVQLWSVEVFVLQHFESLLWWRQLTRQLTPSTRGCAKSNFPHRGSGREWRVTIAKNGFTTVDLIANLADHLPAFHSAITTPFLRWHGCWSSQVDQTGNIGTSESSLVVRSLTSKISCATQVKSVSLTFSSHSETSCTGTRVQVLEAWAVPVVVWNFNQPLASPEGGLRW